MQERYIILLFYKKQFQNKEKNEENEENQVERHGRTQERESAFYYKEGTLNHYTFVAILELRMTTL